MYVRFVRIFFNSLSGLYFSFLSISLSMVFIYLFLFFSMLMGFVLLKFLLLLLLLRKMCTNPYRPIRNFEVYREVSSGGFRGGAHTRRAPHPPFAIQSCVLTAIRASFGKKLRAQEEPESLPPDAFPELQIMPKLLLRPGLRPGPRWGSLQYSPDC